MSQSGRSRALVGALLVAGCASSSPTPAPATAATPPAGPAGTPAAATPPPGAKEVLAVIKEIEAEPFRVDDAFMAKRRALTDWLTKSPDIEILLCLEPLSLDKERPYDSSLFAQMMFGQAAYLLEHPGTPPGDETVFVNGVASAVRAYRKLLALHPEERRAEWDQLDTAERQQSLAPRVKACLKR
jgi:hypothetical protein